MRSMDALMNDRTFLDVLCEKEGLKKDPTLEEWEDFEKWWKWPFFLPFS